MSTSPSIHDHIARASRQLSAFSSLMEEVEGADQWNIPETSSFSTSIISLFHPGDTAAPEVQQSAQAIARYCGGDWRVDEYGNWWGLLIGTDVDLVLHGVELPPPKRWAALLNSPTLTSSSSPT